MKILHISNGWEEWNGAAVIARLVMGEQRAAGHEVSFDRWAGVRRLREADEVWIHCGWTPCLLWASLWAKKSVRMPEACYDPKRLAYHGWKKRLVGPFERWALRRSESVVVTCRDEGEWVKKYEPRVKRTEVSDIKRFFRLDAPNVRPKVERHMEPLHVLYLGRPHPLKGVKYLELAISELNHWCSTWIPGCSNRQCFELRIVSNAKGEEKEKVWEWADVLCLPTLTDNFGLVVAEALERGRSVITTDGAPAWDASAEREKPVWADHLTYLRGFREGTDEQRVALLKDALKSYLD